VRRFPAAVLVVAGSTFVVLMAVSTRYGWHRDELYFIACGRRLAWGYVDQPPFVPAVARVSEALFGTSLAGLRLWPALALVGVVLMTAAIARELGGGAFAQGLAALATGICPLFLGEGHLLATATFDLFFWTAITLVVVRLLRTGDQRLWLAAGALAGMGLQNKHSVVFLLFGLLAGLLLTPERRQLASPWLWGGIAMAALIWAPNVIWHAQHDWPVFDMLDSLREEGGTEARILFIPSQLFVLSTLAVLWIPGLIWLLRDRDGRPWSSLAVAYLALVALFVITGGKPYYAAGIYPVLLAAGAGVWERGAHRRRALVWVVAGGLVAMPLAIPVAPVSLAQHHPIEDLEMEFGSQLGWHDLVEQVAQVRDSLPPAQRRSLTIFTGDYGAAGAIDLWGHEYDLPKAVSGHNNYWIWGYDRAVDGATTIVLGLGLPRVLSRVFEGCVLKVRVGQPHDVAAEEAGAPIYVCQRPRASWAELWPQLRHYSA
jgi:4-amino-4-deoxy-L-arabinose transferase-like glycosyltransferase